ncbi:MAG: DMT family transporter [Acetobacteraceae bacterium]|nr:DMT family transporter [Acetobacteraceae bacterium]
MTIAARDRRGWPRLWDNAYLLLAAVALFWAGNSIVGRGVKDSVPPFTLALARWTGALLILAPFAWNRVRHDRWTLLRRWKETLLLGLLGVGAFNALLYSGLHYTTATNGLLIQSAMPPIILFLAYLLFRETARPRQVIGVALSMCGVLLIVARGQLGRLAQLQIGIGDVLVFAAVIAWSFYTVLLRLRPLVHPLSFLAATFAIGIGAMLPLSILEWALGARIVWSIGSIAALFYVAIFPSLIAYLLFNRGVQLIGAGAAGQVLNLTPVFGACLAIALLGEPFETYHLIGMALILSGIALFARGRRP